MPCDYLRVGFALRLRWRYREEELNSIIGQISVSYTHLDVYKRQPYIVNASDSILKVLSRLKKDKVHMAIVMQGSSPVGIVTMQDLIEELIGDISEEVRSHNVILLQDVYKRQHY